LPPRHFANFDTSPAHAAVGPTGAEAPGFYRYEVGVYECTSINDRGAHVFEPSKGAVGRTLNGETGGPLRDRPFAICERYVSQIMRSMHLHGSRDPA
jgi:hypothetical protein